MKSIHIKSPLKVYLAGKISKNCWRHSLVDDLRYHQWDMGPLIQSHFIYIGPFFVGCDHGCYHYPSNHGSSLTSTFGCYPELELEKAEVAKKCRDAIAEADLVFAYINAKDCYGTIAEIERAHTLGKRVIIVFGPKIKSQTNNDMWFVTKGACRVHHKITTKKLKKVLDLTLEEIALGLY